MSDLFDLPFEEEAPLEDEAPAPAPAVRRIFSVTDLTIRIRDVLE